MSGKGNHADFADSAGLVSSGANLYCGGEGVHPPPHYQRPTMSAPRPQVIAFLDAIKENPDDDTPRLILADWLMENGDEVRGEFLQLQCRLAPLAEDDPNRAALVAREVELLQRH